VGIGGTWEERQVLKKRQPSNNTAEYQAGHWGGSEVLGLSAADGRRGAFRKIIQRLVSSGGGVGTKVLPKGSEMTATGHCGGGQEPVSFGITRVRACKLPYVKKEGRSG